MNVTLILPFQVSNKVAVARIAKTEEHASPEFTEVSSIKTEDKICTVFSEDAPRLGGLAQLVAGGLGDSFVIYGVTKDKNLLQLTAGIKCKVRQDDGSTFAEVKCIAFDRSQGRMVATGDGAGNVRLFTLEAVDAVLANLAGCNKFAAPVSTSGVSSSPGDGAAVATVKTTGIAVGKSIRILFGHSDAVTSLCFSGSGKRVSCPPRARSHPAYTLNAGYLECPPPPFSSAARRRMGHVASGM